MYNRVVKQQNHTNLIQLIRLLESEHTKNLGDGGIVGSGLA